MTKSPRPPGRPKSGVLAQLAAQNNITIRELVTVALAESQGNIAQASRMLSIHRKTLDGWIDRLNIRVETIVR